MEEIVTLANSKKIFITTTSCRLHQSRKMKGLSHNRRRKNITDHKFFAMKITEHIAQYITDVHEGGNWTEVNIKDTLADVGYKEATTVTRVSNNSIAAMVYHISFYNDVVMQRLSGNDPVLSESNGFDMAAIKNEDDWIKLKERNIQSAQQLASAVREFPEEKIFEHTSTGHATHYKTLHGISEHAHYHLGQIVLLKKLIRQTKQKPARSNSL